MKEKKDQFVIAYIADFNHCTATLSYALFLAQMVKKGLVLLHVSDPRYTQLQPHEAAPRLQALQQQYATAEVPSSYAALSGSTQEVLTSLPTLLGAVAVVAQVDPHAARRSAIHRRQLLRNFSLCKTAFLIVQDPLPEGKPALRDVALSVDFKKESKDKYIWTSYFARFNGSTVHALYYDYKDEFLKHKWYSNMKFLHKLFSSLNLTFQPHIIPSRSTYTDINALRYAVSQGYGLLVSVTTKERDAIEWIIGTQEQRLIANPDRMPILFLNPREDLYVLCD